MITGLVCDKNMKGSYKTCVLSLAPSELVCDKNMKGSYKSALSIVTITEACM